jgi:hypothetical protein
MKYDNYYEYLEALEQKLQQNSHGNETLFVDLRKDMALERLAARFDPGQSAVKGGFGVRTLVPGSPLTQDMDILIDNKDWQGLSKEQAFKLVGEYIVDHMSMEGSDQFKYTPTGSAKFVDLGPDQAAARIWAQVSVAERSFGTVVIDAGVKDQSVPVERASGRDVLGFAEVENPIITTVSREYLAADKVTLFLEKGIYGDRPRDIVHGALLLEEGKYNEAALSTWIEKLGERRGVTGLLAEPLEPPTKAWGMKVNSICDRYGLQLNVESCYERIGGMLDRLFGRER